MLLTNSWSICELNFHVVPLTKKITDIWGNTSEKHPMLSEFPSWAFQQVDPSTWVQGCDLEPSPWQSDNIYQCKKKKKNFIKNVQSNRLDCCLCALTCLCHLHGDTFRKIPLDVFKVHLRRAARYMRQLHNKRQLISLHTTGGTK